jgi:hypothetical protein
MRTNTQEAVLSAYIASIGKPFPRSAACLIQDEDLDLRSFAGGNVGLPNFREDAEKRLIRNAAEAHEVRSTISKLAKSNPELARGVRERP